MFWSWLRPHCCWLPVVAGCGENMPAGAIATVGDGVVTQQQFDEIVNISKKQAANASPSPQAFPSPGTQQYNYFAAQVVNMLVNQELMKQQAAKLGITVTDKQINDEDQAVPAAVRRREEVRQVHRDAGHDDRVRQDPDQEPAPHPGHLREGDVGHRRDRRRHEGLLEAAQRQLPAEGDAHRAPRPGEDQGRGREGARAARGRPSDANWKAVAKKYSIDPGTQVDGRQPGAHQPGHDGRGRSTRRRSRSRRTSSRCRSRRSTAGTSSR